MGRPFGSCAGLRVSSIILVSELAAAQMSALPIDYIGTYTER